MTYCVIDILAEVRRDQVYLTSGERRMLVS